MAETFYNDVTGLLLYGDAKDSLKHLANDSVDFCITSPPYWAQRDYGASEQLGQEADFRDYLTKLSDIFLEVQRVLKPTGSLWVVINDTWFSERKGSGGKGSIQDGSIGSSFGSRKYEKLMQPKCLINIPHRLAIKMTDDHNWIHRMTVCWHKNNVMPQPHGDKFTRDFEYILVFSKTIKPYYIKLVQYNKSGNDDFNPNEWKPARDFFSYKKEELGKADPNTRNMRAVWDFGFEENEIWEVNNNKPAGLKHYATYPEELVRRAITFGCPEGGVVLDPFLGSGTTAKVAKEMGRRWIGCEINPEYCKFALERINGTPTSVELEKEILNVEA